RAGTRLGIRDFGGYEDDPLGLSRQVRFREASRRQPALLGHANIRWVLDPSNKTPLPPSAQRRRDGVAELTEVAPAVLYVPAPVAADDVDAALAALARIAPGTGAVVEGSAPAGPPGAAPTSGAFTTYEPNHVVAEIDTPGPGLVVIAEAYYPAWRATVDGEPAAILPANGMFRGVPVTGAGHHVIDMNLQPARFRWLLPAHLIALLLLLGAVSAPRWRRLRERSRRRTDKPSGSSAPRGEGSA
ncbi:MAG TPA: hypothetical protein VL172_22860, partial [Kofleriaceae bacterium]|nr:hypothetical protein [Kofleriaceae bacterium]